MIRQIHVIEDAHAIRDDLEITRSRLASDKDARALAPRIEALIAEVDELLSQTPAGEAHGERLTQLVARTNEVRCKIFGELMGTVCAAGKGPRWAKQFFQQAARLRSTASLNSATPSKKRASLTAEDWRARALERGLDAEALAEARPDTVGPVYMAGYAIECSLKAYLRRHSIPFATSGREGHDLGGLWKAAGWGLTHWKGDPNVTMYYTQDWTTDLRYQESIGSQPLSTEALVEGARKLSRWIQEQMQRKRNAR